MWSIEHYGHEVLCPLAVLAFLLPKRLYMALRINFMTERWYGHECKTEAEFSRQFKKEGDFTKMEYRKQKNGITEMEPLCSHKIGFYSPQSAKGVLMDGFERCPEEGAV